MLAALAACLVSLTAFALEWKLVEVKGSAPQSVGPPPGAWRFKEVRVFNNLKEARVLKAKHDTSGGEAELQLDGEANNLCPGGDDRREGKLHWRPGRPHHFQLWREQGAGEPLQ